MGELSLLPSLLRQAGHEPVKNSYLGRVFIAEGVRESDDLARIRKLPRRRWQDRPPSNLSTSLARSPHVSLFPMQEAALDELRELGSLNCVASLGAGKTLVTALAPVVLDAKRPLFLNYKRLIDKTEREFAELAQDWRVCDNYTFLSVEKLSRDHYADYLERTQPDFICVDEAHSLANPTKSRFRRLRRYKRSYPHVPILLLTGTPGADSLRQYAHLHDLLLGEGSPLPRDWHTLMEWCEALDTDVRGQRRPPGALISLSAGNDKLEAVRAAVGARVEETFGNVYSRTPESIDCSIYITGERVDLNATTDALINTAGCDMILPDGRCFEEMYNRALIIKQLGAGYAKVLDPTPPQEWREIRSLWGTYAREVMSRGKLDTPAQVKAAVRRGEIDDGGLLEMWRAIEPTFRPQTKTEWFDLSVVNYAAEWLSANDGLVWVTQPTVGRRIAEITRLPFFHANGEDVHVGSIEGYRRKTGAVLAVRPNMLGRNLQRWHKNLYITPSASSIELDQSIGRTARRGQKQPTVDVTFVLAVFENWSSVMTARASAVAERALGKNQSSRLLNCDWCVPDAQTVSRWAGYRWRRR